MPGQNMSTHDILDPNAVVPEFILPNLIWNEHEWTYVDQNASSTPTSDLKSAITSLQSQKSEDSEHYKTLRRHFDLLKIESERHKREATIAHQELAQLRESFDGLEGFTQDLRIKHKMLEKECRLDKISHESLLEKMLDGWILVLDLNTQLSNSIQRNVDLESRVSELLHAQPPSKSNQLSEELEIRVSELLHAQQLREPLFQVGVAIRRRFFEQARMTVLCHDARLIDHQIIKEGNAAAHNANGSADAALILGGFCNGGNQPELFKILYESGALGWQRLPGKARQAIDYRATVVSLEVVSRDQANAERLLVSEHLAKIREIFTRRSAKAFEEDEQVTRRLAIMKELVSDIIEADRKRRGGFEGLTRRSTQY